KQYYMGILLRESARDFVVAIRLLFSDVEDHETVRNLAALALLTVAAGYAQDSSLISLDNGVQLKIAAAFGNPTGQETLTVQMARATGNSVYRIFRDQNQLAVYAYQLSFDLALNGTAVSVTASPYDEQFVTQFPLADGGKPTPTLSEDRPLGAIGSGQASSLDLFNIPGMGLSVSETISVEIDSRRVAGPLRFENVELSINGKIIPVVQQRPVSGEFVLFYVPGRGAFIFSASDPGHGFLKTGVIDGDRMKFFLDNDQYDCEASQPILTRPETGQLWVLHLADYKPAGDWTTHPRAGETRPAAEQFFAAASDSLSWWLP
ncbi:MAG TPA: hypothetical protein VMB85_21835, partial [Bryobacteraceae bacterium]|nr:hypothetical protein [Bryobacteraceae bacterium]